MKTLQLKLPKEAVEKFKSLQQEMADAHALIKPIHSAIRDQREKLQDKKRFFHDLTENSQYRRVSADDPLAVTTHEEIKALEGEIDRLNGLIVPRTAKMEGLSALLTNIENWFARVPSDAKISLHVAHAEQAVTADEISGSLSRLQRRGREIISEMEYVRAAPLPAADAKAIALAELDKIARAGQPDVLPVIERGGKIAWAEEQVINYAERSPIVSSAPNSLAFLVWLNRAAVTAAIEHEIDQLADDEHALSRAEQATRLDVLRRDLLAIEREEEQLICRAATLGQHYVRRSEADPRAVLGLSDELPAPVTVP